MPPPKEQGGQQENPLLLHDVQDLVQIDLLAQHVQAVAVQALVVNG